MSFKKKQRFSFIDLSAQATPKPSKHGDIFPNQFHALIIDPAECGKLNYCQDDFTMLEVGSGVHDCAID